MPTPPRSKRFYYKKAAFLSGKDQTLQLMLAEAFGKKPKPSQRTQKLTIGDEEENELAIIYRTTHKMMLCGILHHCKPGDPVLATVITDDADNYSVEQFLPPKTSPGKRLEFIKHLLFFGVRDNHVVIVQSIGLTSRELEIHLNWLLKERAKVAIPNEQILLEDNIPEEYRGRPIVGAKAVTITSTPEVLPHTSRKSHSKEDTEQAVWRLKEDPIVSAIMDLIRKGNPGFSKAQIAEMDDAFEKGALEARVEVRYKGGKKGEHTPVVDELARALRHTEDLEYKIELPRKEPLTSSDTRIARNYSVKMRGSFPSMEDMFEKMVGMLDDLVKKGDVMA